MRFFKSHPALAALTAVAVLMLLGGAAYAVVREVFVTIDPEQSAPEIQQSLQQQLEAAGVPSTVRVDKNDDKLRVTIGTDDPSIGQDVKVSVNGVKAERAEMRVQLEIACDLDDAQKAAFQVVVSSQHFMDIAVAADATTDADTAARITVLFHDAGFKDVDVKVAESVVTVTVNAPPVTK
jgi:hypothetical protein